MHNQKKINKPGFCELHSHGGSLAADEGLYFYTMTYSEKLKDPRWQKRKKEILFLDNNKCRRCGTKFEMLNVHHLCYIKGREIWDYRDNQLITLCEICHRHTHEEMKFKKQFKHGRIKDTVSILDIVKGLGGMKDA